MACRRTVLGHIALLVLIALVGSIALVLAPASPAHADVGAPSWWDGDCDANHWNTVATAAGWTGPGAHRLGASYLGVPVCGPRRSGDAAPTVRWSRAGWGHFEWECVELAMRFMGQVYGVTAYGANGNTVVTNYSTTYGGNLQKVSNGTVGVAPMPGDVISFDDPGNPYVTTHFGHVAVVVASTVTTSGNGTIMLMSQNDSVDGWRQLTVTNWVVGGFGYGVATGWLHDPAGRGGPVAMGDGPGAASPGSGVSDAFARGSDDGLWTRERSGGTWGPWRSLGGIITAAPAAASSRAGSVTVLVRGRDNAIWTQQIDSGTSGGWQSLGGFVTTAPAIVASAPGELDLFARGGDNALWTRHFSNGVWDGWKSLGGFITTAAAGASSAAGTVEVFAVGGDKAMWTRRAVGGVWGPWSSLGGVVASTPGAVSSAPGVIDLFARGADNAVATRRSTAGTWSDWSSVGWIVTSPIAAVVTTTGGVELYARALDGSLSTLVLHATSPPSPTSLGGIIK